MPDDQAPPNRSTVIAKAWRTWLLLFIPGFVVVTIATGRFGLAKTLPVLLGLLIVMLLYQRFINKRSWHSILWGVYASDS